jgi:hypothetical protein
VVAAAADRIVEVRDGRLLLPRVTSG